MFNLVPQCICVIAEVKATNINNCKQADTPVKKGDTYNNNDHVATY